MNKTEHIVLKTYEVLKLVSKFFLKTPGKHIFFYMCSIQHFNYLFIEQLPNLGWFQIYIYIFDGMKNTTQMYITFFLSCEGEKTNTFNIQNYQDCMIYQSYIHVPLLLTTKKIELPILFYFIVFTLKVQHIREIILY